MGFLISNLLHVDTLMEDFAEMQRLANAGDYDALADHIAMLCYNYMGNQLDKLNRTFSITSGSTYSISIPHGIDLDDLLAAADKHGASYSPDEGNNNQGHFFTFVYRP